MSLFVLIPLLIVLLPLAFLCGWCVTSLGAYLAGRFSHYLAATKTEWSDNTRYALISSGDHINDFTRCDEPGVLPWVIGIAAIDLVLFGPILFLFSLFVGALVVLLDVVERKGYSFPSESYKASVIREFEAERAGRIAV